MNVLALIAIALAVPSPRGRSELVLFKNQKYLLEKGQLAAHAEMALAEQAKRIKGDQLTVTICLGQEQSPTSVGLEAVAAKAVASVAAVLPEAEITWTGQELEVEQCPRGLILETWHQPTFDEYATLQPLGGRVHVKLPSGKDEEAGARSRLPLGSVVETEIGSRCAVRFLDRLVVRLGTSSRIEVVALRPSSRLFLSAGRIWVWATASDPARIETPNGLVELPPGHYRVTVDKEQGGTTRVESLAGTVRLSRGEKRGEVESGFGATMRGEEVVTGIALPTPPVRLRPARGAHLIPVNLTWDAVEGAATYRVWLAYDVGFNRIAHVDLTTEPEYALQGVAPGEYFWRVTAVDGEGYEGKPSALFRIQVATPTEPAPEGKPE